MQRWLRMILGVRVWACFVLVSFNGARVCVCPRRGCFDERQAFDVVCGVLCAAVCGLVPTGMASASELPDGRGYEQVSPEEKYGTEVYQPAVQDNSTQA